MPPTSGAPLPPATAPEPPQRRRGTALGRLGRALGALRRRVAAAPPPAPGAGGAPAPAPSGTARDGTFREGTAWGHPGWACRRQTTPSLRLRYPDDAEAPFFEIHRAMFAWAQPPGHRPHDGPGNSGPWIENVWISQFWRAYTGRDARDAANATLRPPPLAAIFGPFVPLLLTWVDTWLAAQSRYPPAFLPALRGLLRPDVPYVTVSQNDEGITGKGELPMAEFPNFLVPSAGGYGHVPVPLLKQPEEQLPSRPVRARRIFLSYVGSLVHAPRQVRLKMHGALQVQSRRLGVKYYYYSGSRWRDVMRDSVLSLGAAVGRRTTSRRSCRWASSRSTCTATCRGCRTSGCSGGSGSWWGSRTSRGCWRGCATRRCRRWSAWSGWCGRRWRPTSRSRARWCRSAASCAARGPAICSASAFPVR